MTKFLETLFLTITGYTYTNLARLFMRLFVGVMLLQFGIRHLVNFSAMKATFPAVIGLDSEASLILMIAIETICSIFIMAGFLTRLAVIPPTIAMIVAENHIFQTIYHDTYPYNIDSLQPGYLPIMFIGIFLYILLAGPGKISLDYFISLFVVARRGKDDTDTEELEEV